MICKMSKYKMRKIICGIWALCACIVLLASSFVAAFASPPTDVLSFSFENSVSESRNEEKSDSAPEKIGDENMALVWKNISMPQDFGVYLEKRALTCESFFDGEEAYVGIVDIILTFVPEADVSESETCVAASCDGFDFSANACDGWLSVNERYIPCEYKTGKSGALMMPVSVVSKVFSTEVSVSGDFESVTFSKSGGVSGSVGDCYDEDELYWLSRIISAESRGESIYGKIAVGNVVLNRVSEEGFPNTVYGVIFDSSCGVQFTPVSDGSVFNEPDSESVMAAKLCLEGYSVSTRILYFFNPDTASDNWISENRTFAMTIGNHSFYS